MYVYLLYSFMVLYFYIIKFHYFFKSHDDLKNKCYVLWVTNGYYTKSVADCIFQLGHLVIRRRPELDLKYLFFIELQLFKPFLLYNNNVCIYGNNV